MESGELLHWLPSVKSSVLPPVVLLHGSGQDERALLSFAVQACPGHSLVPVRGRVAWEGGFAFFRRNPDRTLDYADLARGADAIHSLLGRLLDEGCRPPVLLGYSNGAIAAAAALALDPSLSAGAVLVRPLTPWPDGALPALAGYPVLLVAARGDDRRQPHDAPTLHGQLRAVGAAATLSVVSAGHPLTDRDAAVVASWLVSLASPPSAG